MEILFFSLNLAACVAVTSCITKQTIRHISELGLVTAIFLSLGILFAGPAVIDLLTNAEDVRLSSRAYLLWVVATPIVSLWCFLLDGVFIGATCTREMRNAMVASLAIYLGAFYVLTPFWHNHGLWLSLMIYYLARALTLMIYLPNLRRLAEIPH